MGNAIVADGVWCIGCERFESELDADGDLCMLCGCSTEVHAEAEVVQR